MAPAPWSDMLHVGCALVTRKRHANSREEDSKLTETVLERPLPVITGMNAHYWCGGADGRLHILCCQDCGHFAHPYVGRCRLCHSKQMQPKPVSGHARICGFTVNHQPWFPHVPTPYIFAYVELQEQDDIRLSTNIINCPVDQVHIGMQVKVVFEQHGDIFIPLFEPA